MENALLRIADVKNFKRPGNNRSKNSSNKSESRVKEYRAMKMSFGIHMCGRVISNS